MQFHILFSINVASQSLLKLLRSHHKYFFKGCKILTTFLLLKFQIVYHIPPLQTTLQLTFSCLQFFQCVCFCMYMYILIFFPQDNVPKGNLLNQRARLFLWHILPSCFPKELVQCILLEVYENISFSKPSPKLFS